MKTFTLTDEQAAVVAIALSSHEPATAAEQSIHRDVVTIVNAAISMPEVEAIYATFLQSATLNPPVALDHLLGASQT